MHSRELVSMLAGADETLHQLVGNVIVLGEELAGDVEGDGIRAMPLANAHKFSGDEIERLVPTRLAPVEDRRSQPIRDRQRFLQRGALRT